VHLGHLAGPDGPRLFAADADGWVVVADAVPDGPATLDDLVAGDGDWLTRIDQALANGATPGRPPEPLAAPFARPRTVIAIGLNYADHCREFGTPPPTTPVVFTKLPPSVVGDREDVVWSADVTDAVDWEAELGVVIGAPARDVGVDDALSRVFGYTVVNDVTARDLQKLHGQWFLGKSLDTFCPMGPWIVTADAIDPANTRVQCWVNGELRQDANTADLIFDIPTLIATISAGIELRPGDVIVTGTPVGVGIGFKPPKFLKAGDVVRISIDGIGTIENTVR